MKGLPGIGSPARDKPGGEEMNKNLLLIISCTLVAFLLFLPAPSRAESGLAYEIFVGSFADSNGDGIGDLKGIEEKLEYIAELNVDWLWLTPIHPSPSYHHYDVLDYCAVAPEFGTIEDFDSLAAACEEKGIGLMLDLVVNHTSSEHPWFLAACEALASGENSEYVDWYQFTKDSGQHPVNSAEGWYYEGPFGYHMPDLNLDNPAVREEIARIIAFWQGHGVKGFRLDATTSYYTGDTEHNAEFLRFITETAKAGDENCYIVGEAWTTGNTVLSLYKSGIDSLFDFPAADVEGVLIKAASKGTGAKAASTLAAWNESVRSVSPDSLDAPFLSNHDIARSRGMLRSDLKKMKIAAMTYLLLPGRPFIYYGEEIGMSGSGRDENKRLPMLWSAGEDAFLCDPPKDADQEQRLQEGVDVQASDPESLLSWYRHLTAIRAQAPELERGTMAALDTGSDALCAFTVTNQTTVAVLINTSSKAEAALDLGELGLEHCETVGTAGVTLEEFQASGALPPCSCIVLRLPE